MLFSALVPLAVPMLCPDAGEESLTVTHLSGRPPLSHTPDLPPSADRPAGEVGDRRRRWSSVDSVFGSSELSKQPGPRSPRGSTPPPPLWLSQRGGVLQDPRIRRVITCFIAAAWSGGKRRTR